MPRTVTVRLSVVAGLVLLLVGTGLYGYGFHLNATSCPDGASVHTMTLQGSDPTERESVVNFSDLSRKQRGVFLLALEDGFTTSNSELEQVMHDLPSAIRYDGRVLVPSFVVGDCFPNGGGDYEFGGVIVTVLGILVLLRSEVTN